MTNDVIQQQIEYYRARANEYDQWFYRTDRYDRGKELNQRWFDELAIVRTALHQIKPVEHILELACGTGIWTQELLQIGQQITAIDAVSEVIEINQ
ncbi:class I SAM-dependent methyltransferase [Nostoc sp.]